MICSFCSSFAVLTASLLCTMATDGTYIVFGEQGRWVRVWARMNGRRGLGAQREVVWKCPPEERLCLWAKGSFTVLPKVGVSVNALLEVNTWVDLSVFNSSGNKWLDLKQQDSMWVWQPQNMSWQDDMARYEAEIKAKVKAKEDAQADVNAKKQRLRSMPWKAKKEQDAETKAKMEEEITIIYPDEWWKKPRLRSRMPGCQRPWQAKKAQDADAKAKEDAEADVKAKKQRLRSMPWKAKKEQDAEAKAKMEEEDAEAKANAKLQLEGPLVHHCQPVRATHIGASNWRNLSAYPASAATASAAPPSAASVAAASPASPAPASAAAASCQHIQHLLQQHLQQQQRRLEISRRKWQKVSRASTWTERKLAIRRLMHEHHACDCTACFNFQILTDQDHGC